MKYVGVGFLLQSFELVIMGGATQRCRCVAFSIGQGPNHPIRSYQGLHYIQTTYSCSLNVCIL